MMRFILLFTLAALPACSSASRPSAPWQNLFDGKSLDGWVQRGGKAKYRVDDGQIVGSTVPNTPNSFLCTTKTYGDFILEVEYKVDPKMNSGIQVRSESYPEYKNGQVHGYQVEIDPSPRKWSAGIYDEGRRGWLNDLKGNPAAGDAFRQGQWNKYRIEAIGDHFRTWINGVPAADLVDSMTPEGFIALQVHGVKAREEPMEVRWRNIRIQDLGRQRWVAGKPDRPMTDFTVRMMVKDSAAGHIGIRQTWEVATGPAEKIGGVRDIMRSASAAPDADATKKAKVKAGDWNKLTISAHGDRIVVHVNDIKTAEVRDAGLHAGQIVPCGVEWKDLEFLRPEPR